MKMQIVFLVAWVTFVVCVVWYHGGWGRPIGAFIKTKDAKNSNHNEWAKWAKISMTDAIAAAQKWQPGHVWGAKLANEDGVVVYAVFVNTPNEGLKEVLVDASTGRVLTLNAADNDSWKVAVRWEDNT